MKAGKNIISIVLAVCFTVFIAGCSGSANDAGTLLHLAAKEAQNGKNSDALMLAKEACMLSPDNVEALLMRSLMAERCKDRPLALDSALQAVKLAPEHFAALYTVGRLYSYSPDSAVEAVSYLEKAHSINSEDINTLILLSNLTVSLKSPKALDFLNKIDALDSEVLNNFAGRTMFGHAYAIRGKNNNKKATIAFGHADRMGRNILSNYNYAVAIDCLYNKPSAAVAKYQTFLKQSAAKPEYAAMRKAVEKRLQKIKKR